MDPGSTPGVWGIEAVVDLLCEALVARGHEVTLFAAPGSRSTARLSSPLEAAHPDEIGSSLYESDHVAAAWDEIDLAAELGEAFERARRHAIQGLFANAAALLMPVCWREPFGMVMIEALACGTPVIAFPEGAAAQIVIDGENGMLVADDAEMAAAVKRFGSIDPQRCRATVAERYDISVTVAGYEHAYRRVIAACGRGHASRATGTVANGV